MRTVWIVGSSIISRAQKYSNSTCGEKLDLQHINVIWAGRSGLKWEDLELYLNNLLHRFNGNAPHALVIHCGGNSIGLQSLKKLQIEMKSLLRKIHTLMPNTLLIWSDILPRQSWRHMLSNIAAENGRQRINCSLGSFVRRVLQGALIMHPDIKPDQTKLFCDGVHLSNLGNSLFINSIKAALTKFLSSNSRKYPNPV